MLCTCMLTLTLEQTSIWYLETCTLNCTMMPTWNTCSQVKLGVWSDDQIALLGKCKVYLVHPDTKKSIEVTFYVTDKSGSTLLSCATSLMLDLIKLCPRLGVPPLRAKIIISKADRVSPAARGSLKARSHLMRWAHWHRNLPHTTAPFSPIHCSVPYSPIQMATSGHRKTSYTSKWSGRQAESYGTKISPIWLPHLGPIQHLFNPIHCSALCSPVQPCAALFKPCAAPFKWQPVVREKQGRYKNDQHNELSYMGPRSAPYDCPVWALFNPHSAPFTVQPCVAPFKPSTALFIIQPCAGALFRGDDFPVQYHKIHQNVQLNQQRKLQQSRPSGHSQQPSLPVTVTQKEQIKALYSEVFEGIGCFPGKPYHINLD